MKQATHRETVYKACSAISFVVYSSLKLGNWLMNLLTGGSEYSSPVQVAGLRPDGVAYR